MSRSKFLSWEKEGERITLMGRNLNNGVLPNKLAGIPKRKGVCKGKPYPENINQGRPNLTLPP